MWKETVRANGLILEASNGVISPRQQRFNPINKDVETPGRFTVCPALIHMRIFV